jgi:hypothetical protein
VRNDAHVPPSSPTCREEAEISTITHPGSMTLREYRQLARAALDGLASDAEIAHLRDEPEAWTAALEHLLADVDATLQRVRDTVTGPERPLVLEDFTDERARIRDALIALTGRDPDAAKPTARPQQAEEPEPEPEPEIPLPAVVQLQLSWQQGLLVAWASGPGCEPDDRDALLARLQATGASPGAWSEHEPVALPDGQHAPAVVAPIRSTLGWLVGLRESAEDDALAPGARWLGHVAAMAVRLVAQGRMVPQLERADAKGGRGGRAPFAVRWAPALIHAGELKDLSRSLPGTVGALVDVPDPRAFTESVAADFLDAICADAAGRIEVPAPPPDPRSENEIAETVLARLGGSPFEAPEQRGAEVAKGMARWARPVTGATGLRLIVQLDPPDEGDAWHLRTLTSAGGKILERGDAAMANAAAVPREGIKRELDRLELLFPPLQRGKATRRGEVILSQDEAWDLMTTTGAVLVNAGFDVRVPPLSRKKPSPGLRLTSMGSGESVVGASQLTTVRWSAVFDDVELDVADIMRLAKEARPLVKARGRWVELDKADLQAAAEALAERADRTQLTGAEMLRHALGLDGPSLAGGIDVAGQSWAADLLRAAGEIDDEAPTKPEGFAGELRSYQAEALAWLRFLDEAGLGGCLALDMGLGKTPTVLAHLHETTAQAPALVIVPPAVAGNWAAEARRFVPDLKVMVHHGQNRAPASRLAGRVEDADVVITTYGTAVRDIAALEAITWGSVVLDEAQVIKNPASETSQQLRRLQASSKICLTGTPIENGLGDLWALLDFTNPGLVGDRATFVSQLSRSGESRSAAEQALRTLNGVLVFRRTKAEPAIAAELPDRIDVLDHCPMTPEQIGLYQAVLDDLVAAQADDEAPKSKGAVLAAITALKQICNHPAAYRADLDEDGEAVGVNALAGRSGKLERCEEIVDNAFAADERVLVFTHFAAWGEQLARHLTKRTGKPIHCYHGGLSRGARDAMVKEFQAGEGAGALVLSLKAGGTGLNLTAASHVVLYDRWWNPAVEDQARDRAWRIGQTKTVVAHRLVCPGTVDERVEEVVAGKRRIADLVLPESSSVDDLHSEQLRAALGLDADALLTTDDDDQTEEAA